MTQGALQVVREGAEDPGVEAVTNTSPIIFLVHVPELQPLVAWQFSRVWVPEQVVGELVDAARASQRESVRENGRLTELLLSRPPFRVAPARPLERVSIRLGLGERAALGLALAKKVELVLMDDRDGARLARGMGLKPLPLSSLPVRAARAGRLAVGEARTMLQKLLANRYYLSSQHYQQLMESLDSLD